MPIQFRCPTCNKLLSIASRKAGTWTDCPVCGEKIEIPLELPGQMRGIHSPTQSSHNSGSAQEISPGSDLQLQKKESSPNGQGPNFTQNSPTKTSALTKTSPKSILDIDPDRIFGTDQPPRAKPPTLHPQPGILEGMYENQGESMGQPQPDGTDLTHPKEEFPKGPKHSWKLILFAILIIGGLLVASYYAWNLCFPKALLPT